MKPDMLDELGNDHMQVQPAGRRLANEAPLPKGNTPIRSRRFYPAKALGSRAAAARTITYDSMFSGRSSTNQSSLIQQ